MLKNKKILIVMVIALICLLGATVLIINFLSPARTTFYVFSGDFKAGATISKSMLIPVQADSRIVLAGGMTDSGVYFITSGNLAEYVDAGDVLRVDVKKGEAFMISHISSYGGSEVEVKMSPNAVAVTVPVSNITGITKDLSSDSHVNVYASYSTGETVLLLEDIRVLSVEKKETKLEGVTLELTKGQAITVIQAMNTGSLYLGLIKPDGYIYNSDSTPIK